MAFPLKKIWNQNQEKTSSPGNDPVPPDIFCLDMKASVGVALVWFPSAVDQFWLRLPASAASDTVKHSEVPPLSCEYYMQTSSEHEEPEPNQAAALTAQALRDYHPAREPGGLCSNIEEERSGATAAAPNVKTCPTLIFSYEQLMLVFFIMAGHQVLILLSLRLYLHFKSILSLCIRLSAPAAAVSVSTDSSAVIRPRPFNLVKLSFHHAAADVSGTSGLNSAGSGGFLGTGPEPANQNYQNYPNILLLSWTRLHLTLIKP